MCAAVAEQSSAWQLNEDSVVRSTVRAAADLALDAIRNRDGKSLASLVHPGKGVRFSPSAYVNPTEDVVFSRKQIETFWTDSETYLWGYADGSGEPMEMTPSEYAANYVLVGREDFSNPSSVNVNDDQAAGNTRNNAAVVYPDAKRVEYYIAPSEGRSEGGMDWIALRLVFELEKDRWWLIAVIHDAWSV
jgi:hypothetical protein